MAQEERVHQAKLDALREAVDALAVAAAAGCEGEVMSADPLCLVRFDAYADLPSAMSSSPYIAIAIGTVVVPQQSDFSLQDWRSRRLRRSLLGCANQPRHPIPPFPLRDLSLDNWADML